MNGSLISCPDGTLTDPSVGCVKAPGNVLNPDSSLLEIILKFAGYATTLIAAKNQKTIDFHLEFGPIYSQLGESQE